MIWTILKKEFRYNLSTLRFRAGIVLLLLLIVSFAPILLNSHKKQLSDYNHLVSQNLLDLQNLMTWQNLTPSIYNPPEPLALFSRGIEENISSSFRIVLDEIPVLRSSGTSENPLLGVFSVLDMALVFKLILSVLALLLAYDSLSGEKERGTLGLIFSNQLQRHKLILGKFFGGVVTLFLPVFFGFLLTAFMIERSPFIDFDAEGWLRIFFMGLASWLLALVFFSIGLFMSSITKRASDTLITLSLVWSISLIVIPNLSSYLAVRIHPFQPRSGMTQQKQEILYERGQKINSIIHAQSIRGLVIQHDEFEPWGSYYRVATRALIRLRQETDPLIAKVRIEYADRLREIDGRHYAILMRQKNTADFLSILSPVAVYEKVMNSFSRTDATSQKEFERQAGVYREQIIDYLKGNEAFSSLRYSTTLEESQVPELDTKEEVDKKFAPIRDRLLETQPAPLEVSEIPRFHYDPVRMNISLKSVRSQLGLLLFMVLLFLIGTLATFKKFDVR